MAGKKNLLKTTVELTQKQRSFVDILVENWGKISKVDAARQAGYKSAKADGPVETEPAMTYGYKPTDAELDKAVEENEAFQKKIDNDPVEQAKILETARPVVTQ